VNTTIGVAGDGSSLITSAGWLATLGGQAPSYEYGTTELSGINNAAQRVNWATVLNSPFIGDMPLVPVSFLRGNDGWNPIS
ncbi:MAG: hypothetical protein FWE37_07720, partial [Spirochaetaceae bacterium]|nr:hypothetical protein [Spirochaetaceae bacterium]